MNLNPQHPDGGATPADAGAPANDGSADRQFVTFSVAGEMFAVPMGPVQEIIRLPEVAQLPLAPHALEGLANLRGRVLPIINLRSLFGAARREADDATRALVINLGQALGFIVDHVASVVNVEPSQIQAADAIQSVVRTEYLSGLIQQERPEGGTQLLLILDFERLVQAQFAGLQAAGELRRDAALREDVAAAGFVIGLLVAREVQELREAAGDRGPVEHLVRDPGPLRGGDRAADEVRLAVMGRDPAAGRHDEGAAGVQQRLAGGRLQLPPDAMRGGDEGHVVAPFPDGLAGDPRLAVARPEGVGRRVAVEPDHRGPALGQLVEDRAPHRAEPQDRDVEPARHRACPDVGAWPGRVSP